MKTLFSLIGVVWLFSGCSMIQPSVIVPRMDKIKGVNFIWFDSVVDGKEVHVLDKDNWQTVRVELVNRKLTANACIDILNNVSENN